MDLQGLREHVAGSLPEDVFLVDLEFSGDTKGRILRVIVDTEEGVRVDQLTQLSRDIGTRLDERDWTDKAYRLEVNSPGLDRPLDHPRLLAKAIGRRVKLTVVDKQDAESGSEQELRGILRGLTATELELETKQETRRIDRELVRSVRHWLEW